jgi:hypothetical protein
MSKDINILQISEYSLPKYITDYNKYNLEGTYSFYGNQEKQWLKYIENTKNDKHIEIFNKITNFRLKMDYFIFYYLYVNGGFYINENVIIEPNINKLDLTKELIVVKSCVNLDKLFMGCIYCHKHSEQMKIILKCIEDCLKNEINEETIIPVVNTYLYNNVSNNILILNEHIIDNISYIYGDDINTVFFKHYFNTDSKIFKLPDYSNNLPKLKKTDVKNIKIGLTFNLPNQLIELFTNGINQNTIYLYDLLKNIGYDVILIVDKNKVNEKSMVVLNQIYDEHTINYKIFEDILVEEFDIIIQLSISISNSVPLSIIRYLKYINTKLVGYFCGNSYIIDSEKALYNQHKDRNNTKDSYKYVFPDKSPILDEIWSIPQMVNTNLNYWKTLYRCKTIPVPFIWSNKAIKFTSKHFNITEDMLLYKNRGINKKIAIFEPNISLMKWCLPCVLICENTYRINKKLKHIYVTNFAKDKKDNINEVNHVCFENILSTTDLMNDKKISIETRYNTLDFMSRHGDIAVSHQWENPLNYLYFDLAWMGWPIVHNAHLCTDIGYYYNAFNYEEGGCVLNNVIETHDQNVESYIQDNRKNLERYLPSNTLLQKQYSDLISDILK